MIPYGMGYLLQFQSAALLLCTASSLLVQQYEELKNA